MPAQTGNALQGSRQMEPPSCMRAHSVKPTCTHVAQVGALPRGCPHAGKHSCTHTHTHTHHLQVQSHAHDNIVGVSAWHLARIMGFFQK